MSSDAGAERKRVDDADREDSGVDLDLPPSMFRTGDEAEPVVLTMAKRVIGPLNTPARFTVVDDMALFEGDIVLGSAEEVRNPPGDRGIGIVGEEFRWPDGIVAYTAANEVARLVDAAVSHWEQRTPFRFARRTNEADFILFQALNGCFSRVGRQGGQQVISLGAGCGVGAAIHEIGHALGLWHEQSRSDRDEFIEVIFENIAPQHRHNFDKHVLDGDDLGPYDFESIMHYPTTAFSVNGSPTIRVKGGKPIGQRAGLSQGDIAAIRLMYPELDWTAGSPTSDASPGGQRRE